MLIRNAAKVHKLTIPVVPELGSQYVIADISGLGPPKASIIQQPYAFQDGASYVSSKTEIRNIVVTIRYRQLSAGKSVQTLRRELYSIFPTNKKVNLRFESDYFVPVSTEAFLESH